MRHRSAVFLICFLIAAAGCLAIGPVGSFGVETAVSAPAPDQTAGAAAPEGDKSGMGMLGAILGIFLGGITLNLTPCIYPLIPVTISYFGGKSIGKQEGAGISNMALHSLLYVLGLSAMNSMLGVVAALSGKLVGAVLQNPVTLVVVAAILTLFALSMFGFWELRLPNSLVGAASKNYAGYFGSFFIGLTLGVVAAPCIGPFVVGLLVWVASTANPWFGFLIFFSLSLGMGLPLFVLAMLSGRLRRLPRSGEWMLWVRKLMGWVLIGMAAYFLRSILSDTAGTTLMSAVALAGGIHLGWLDSSTAGFRAFEWIKKAGGILGLGIAAALLVTTLMGQGEGIKWQAYSEKIMDEARNSGKPIIIDFSAGWCVPCQQMEKATFHNSAVVEEAEKYFVTIRVDLTEGGDRVKERVSRRYNVRGVPTVVFLKPGGDEIIDLRVQQFMDKDRFLSRMAAARKADSLKE